MRHLNDGLLRLSVDEPGLVSEERHVHLRECMACQGRRQEISARAGRVSHLLVDHAPYVDAQLGLASALRKARPEAVRRGRPLAAAAGVLGVARTRPAMFLAVTLAVLSAGAISGLAQNLVTLLEQPHGAVVVPVPPSDAAGLEALADYGTISYSAAPLSRPVIDAQAAEAEAGYPPLAPGAIPAGAPKSASYRVSPAYTITFTFSAEKARAAAQRRHQPVAPMPADIDATSLYVDVGAIVYAEFGTVSGSPPLLGTARMKTPVVRSSGVTIKRLQDYLLSQPGISPGLAARIRRIDDPAHTLPIPVLSADAMPEPVEVQGVTGSLLQHSVDGTVIVWVKDGFAYGVYGSSSVGDLRAAAETAR